MTSFTNQQMPYMLVNMIQQASGKVPPGIDTLLAVANSRHGPGAHAWPSRLPSDAFHDHLETAAEVRGYFAEEGVLLPRQNPGPRELGALRRLRDATWALAGRGGVARSAQIAAPLVSAARFRLDRTGTMRPAQSGWAGFIAGMIPALFELSAISDRLKTCRNPECDWLFLDRTRNQNRAWCDMAYCGNRAKVRRHAQRQRG